MVGMNSVNPLNLPPTKEVRKIEIQKVVEGFDMEQNNGIQDSSASLGLVGEVDGNLYENNYDSLYHGQYDNDLTDLTSDVFHNDPPKKNKRNND